MTESLLDSWRLHLGSESLGVRLVGKMHPLQFYVGVSDSGQPRMVIRSTARPQLPSLAEVVSVERFTDQSGKWNLGFTLLDRKFFEVFTRLCDDMHTRSSSASNEQVALDRVAVVLDEWRRLLKARPTGVLSLEALRGLIGELWLLLNRFNQSRSMAGAIDGWLGPLGLPQDFWYAGEGFHEVKSIGPSTPRIGISSANQLDAPDLSLQVLVIGSTDEQTPGALTLPVLVRRVIEALGQQDSDLGPFKDRLDRLGVNPSDKYYEDLWFVASRLCTYEIPPDFPAIRASLLSAGIERVSYQIDLAAIESFKQSTTILE